MYKKDKPDFVQSLTNKLTGTTATLLVDYTGLGVKKQQDLKKKLKEAESAMFVAKNRLFRIAAKSADFPDELLTDEILSGQTAFITTKGDPISPIQIMAKFAKENEVPQFKVGVVEGLFQNKENLVRLSKLPSKDVLFAQTVGAIASPMYGVVGVMQANMQKLIYILKAKTA